MNIYYESFLRRDIFPKEKDKCEFIMNAYDSDDTQKHYITMVLEDYIHGASAYTTRKRLVDNVIIPSQCMKRKYGDLDEEYQRKLNDAEEWF